MANKFGKIFEEQWKKSIPQYALLHRLNDSAQSFGQCNGLRFSLRNPFDFILWDSNKHILYCLELKSVANKSVSFERTKTDGGVIHLHQINGLNEWNKYDGTKCGFIIEFRSIPKTIFIDISDFNEMTTVINKKSFRLDDLDKNKIKYRVIDQKILRTKYIYDVDKFLNEED